MHEIELKFQVPAGRRAALDAAVAGRGTSTRVRMQAVYVDSADRALASAGLALRVRREGRQWVQTLKGATADAMVRAEHNVVRGRGPVPPAVDPRLHAGTPVGEALLALLAKAPDAALIALYRTDLLRRTRSLRAARGRVELAFDVGRIQAGTAQLPVCELEIELLAGAPGAVLDTARRWVPRFGLWLDLRSKAERGDALARGEPLAPPRPAGALRLAPGMAVAAALQAVLRSCADQVLGNAGPVASGEHGPEHVHQLRVGLRRLRSALALFDGADPGGTLDTGAAALFRRLGAARDAVVVEAEFAADLRRAMLAAGVDAGAPVDAATPVAEAPAVALRDAASQRLLLDLLAATHAGMPADAEGADLRERVARRLNRWHKQLADGAKAFATLDDAGRHRLRKRAKRLRYASEFCAALFERRTARRYLRSLRALQERLGAISDVVMAMQVFARRLDADPRAMFALGWLAARREVLIAVAAPALKAFTKAERFWKRGQR